MIFGRSYNDKVNAHQRKLALLYDTRILHFAWLPHKTNSGKWVWLQDYWREYNVYKEYGHYSEWGDGLTYNCYIYAQGEE